MTSSTGNEGVGFLGCGSEEDLMDLVGEVNTMILERQGPKKIRSRIYTRGPSGHFADLILDIAKTREKAAEKFPSLRSPFFTSEGLRWATPETAADHCSERISREHVMDITCGQGGQSLSFARFCDRVTAVDMDPLNCLLTRLNCISAGASNVEIVEGDCLSKKVINKASRRCAVFCDPERPPVAGERTMEEISPDPRKVWKEYTPVSTGICFEIPPYMSLDKVDFDCEAEYISLDGRVNRLNLYTDGLQQAERSAIILPSGARLSGSPEEMIHQDEGKHTGEFFYEIDPAVVRAGLTAVMIEQNGWDVTVERLDKRRTIIWSDSPIGSPFLKQGYRVLTICSDLEDVRRYLRDSDIGSVTLRLALDPSDYWNVRNGLEKGLDGTKKAQLFRKGRYILSMKTEDFHGIE